MHKLLEERERAERAVRSCLESDHDELSQRCEADWRPQYDRPLAVLSFGEAEKKARTKEGLAGAWGELRSERRVADLIGGRDAKGRISASFLAEGRRGQNARERVTDTEQKRAVWL